MIHDIPAIMTAIIVGSVIMVVAMSLLTDMLIMMLVAHYRGLDSAVRLETYRGSALTGNSRHLGARDWDSKVDRNSI